MGPYIEWALKTCLLREEGREGESQGGREGRRGGGKREGGEEGSLVLSKCIGMEYMTFRFHLVYFLIKFDLKNFIE